jgi:hypothetical protein
MAVRRALRLFLRRDPLHERMAKVSRGSEQPKAPALVFEIAIDGPPICVVSIAN